MKNLLKLTLATLLSFLLVVFLIFLLASCGARKKTTNKEKEQHTETTVSELEAEQTEITTTTAEVQTHTAETSETKAAEITGEVADITKPATVTRSTTPEGDTWRFENFSKVKTSDKEDKTTAKETKDENQRETTASDIRVRADDQSHTRAERDFNKMDLDRKSPSSSLFFGAVFIFLLILLLDYIRKNRS